MSYDKRIPPRSQMYYLQPIGWGTGAVESLTSYVVRLLDAHQLPVTAFLNRAADGEFFNFGGAVQSFNGYGDAAEKLIRFFEKMTVKTNLQDLTLSRFSSVLGKSHLLKRYFSWCPMCFKDAVNRGQTPYHPLLWSFENTKVCPIHRIPLWSHCPNPTCLYHKKSLVRLTSIVKCPKCGQDLSVVSSDVLSAGQIDRSEFSKQIWIAEQLSLVLSQSFHQTPTLSILADSLSQLTRKHALPNIRSFSIRAGLKPATVNGWVRHLSKPTVEDMIAISDTFECTLKDLLFGIASEQQISALSLKHRNKHNLANVESYLNQILGSEEGPFPSLPLVARRIGTKPTTLKRHFPELCSQIQQRYRGNGQVYPYKGEVLRNKIQTTVKRLIDADIDPFPSAEMIAGMVPCGNNAIKDLCPELYTEILSRNLKNKQHLKEPPSRRQQLIDKLALKRCLEDALTVNPPMPITKILKIWGYSWGTAMKYFPEQSKAIVENFKLYQEEQRLHKEKRIRTEIRAILFEIHAQGIYPSTTQLSKRLPPPLNPTSRHCI